MNFFAPLNFLIQKAYEADLSGIIYTGWHLLNVTAVVLFCRKYRKKYNFSALEAVYLPTVVYLLGFLIMLLIGWAAAGFKHFGDNNIVKVFCFIPLEELLICKIMKLDFGRVADFIAPELPLCQAVGHLACNFGCCCYGYPWKHGVWNPYEGAHLFPIQLLESLAALLVCIACVLYAKKENYNGRGKVYPLCMILFGSTRFLLEFLRDNEKLFWGISELALWALLMFAVGAVWMIVIKTKDRRPALAEAKAQNRKSSPKGKNHKKKS